MTHDNMPRWQVGTLVAMMETPNVLLGKVIEPFNFIAGAMLVQFPDGTTENINPAETVIYEPPAPEVTDDTKDIARQYKDKN